VLVLRVLERERVQVELARGLAKVFTLRIGDVEPARVLAAQLAELVRRAVRDGRCFFDRGGRAGMLEG